MAFTIPLSATPNQALSVTLEGAFYELSLQSVGDTIAITIIRDSVIILSGWRITPGNPLIPFKYLTASNFVWISLDEQLPNYELIGVTQTLVFLTADEVEAA